METFLRRQSLAVACLTYASTLKDGGITSLRNVCELLWDTRCHKATDPTSRQRGRPRGQDCNFQQTK
jgi:hypothetical protein